MELGERKMRILKSIIDEYIDRGEPVGSKHLVQSGNMSLSPATIRNEMSDLEEMGFLDKPHASAGRVPSSSAYRLYAESLMDEYRAGKEQLEVLSELTKFKSDEIDAIVDKARKVMSKMTGYASVTLTQSDDSASRVERFDALKIDATSMLLVMILPDGGVISKHLSVGEAISEADVAVMKSALNLVLSGKSLRDIALPEIMELEKLFGTHKSLVSTILRIAYEATASDTDCGVEVDGITNLLTYPEFHNVEKVKDLLGLFEQDGESFKQLIPVSDAFDRSLKVYVGEDSADAGMVFCSLPVGRHNTIFGILGPRRMDYKKATHVLSRLSRTLGELAGKEEHSTEETEESP